MSADQRGRTGLVLGCGNVLASDDGLGPRVAELLIERRSGRQNQPGVGEGVPAEPPSWVEIVDGGTLGLDLLPLLDAQDVLVLVDAVDASRVAAAPGQPPPSPGTVTVWRGEEVARTFASPLSVHEVAVADLLGAAALANRLPAQVWLVGVQPETTQPGVGLTDAVEASVATAAATVLRIFAEADR